MSKKAASPIPEGMHTVTPVIVFNGNCRQAIDLYKKVFNAKEAGIYDAPDKKSVWHAMIKIGDSNIMMNDVMPNAYEKGPEKTVTGSQWLYVEKCDEVFNTAVKNGFQSIMPPNDTFWGDRFGKVRDPFGHTWGIATRQYEYTPEEMKQKEKEMMAQMQQQ